MGASLYNTLAWIQNPGLELISTVVPTPYSHRTPRSERIKTERWRGPGFPISQSGTMRTATPAHLGTLHSPAPAPPWGPYAEWDGGRWWQKPVERVQPTRGQPCTEVPGTWVSAVWKAHQAPGAASGSRGDGGLGARTLGWQPVPSRVTAHTKVWRWVLVSSWLFARYRRPFSVEWSMLSAPVGKARKARQTACKRRPNTPTRSPAQPAASDCLRFTSLAQGPRPSLETLPSG